MDARDTFRLTILATVAAGGAPAAAAQDDLDPTKPVSEIRVGAGYLTHDSRMFGEYSGLKDGGLYPLFDLSIVNRNDATGTWLRFDGRNLGLESRQLRFEHNRQGNWGYSLEYGRIPRYEPYTATTAVSGIGSSTLTVPSVPTSGAPFDLKTRRDIFGVGFEKIFGGLWDVNVRFRTEEKEGARIFGRGTTGTVAGFPGNFEFTPEPIDSTTRQLDVVLNYNGEKLQLSGGYYGTMYNNRFRQLDISGGVAALATPATTAFTPIALPPDNYSNQLHMSGSYALTPTTRATFKTAYQDARQKDDFPTGPAVPLAPGVGNNLDARVTTVLGQAGIVSRPIPKLTLRGDLRYEDRDDKTPVVQFFTAPGSTSTGHNEPRSVRTTRGAAEASYLLPAQFTITGGIGYEEKKRNTSDVRVVSYREKTEETSYRVEVRRSVSETLTGAVSYIYSDRDGSPFITTTQTSGAVGSNLIAPIHLADRKRDKVRVSSNWSPIEPLSVQFFVDWADDRYSGRDGSALGPRKGEARNYSLDVSYKISDKWSANAWYTYNEAKAEQSTCEAASSAGVCPATAADPIYAAEVRNKSNSVGFGLRGMPHAKVEVGADLSYTDVKDTYFQQPLSPAGGAVPGPLPDIETRITRFNLFAKYALEKRSGLKFDYIFDRFSTNDWTWTNFVYVDGTRLSRDANHPVHFFGVSYYYRFQ
jgi:MtrB/PioB family decaheme-associated outer membrane protein